MSRSPGAGNDEWSPTQRVGGLLLGFKHCVLKRPDQRKPIKQQSIVKALCKNAPRAVVQRPKGSDHGLSTCIKKRAHESHELFSSSYDGTSAVTRTQICERCIR